jgi:alpha-L-fucosidase
MDVVAGWMKRNARSVSETKPLPADETASVPATASALTRYLFLVPQFRNGGSYEDELMPAQQVTVALKGVARPRAVKLLGDGTSLHYSYSDGTVTVEVPPSKRTKLVDVVQIDLKPSKIVKP